MFILQITAHKCEGTEHGRNWHRHWRVLYMSHPIIRLVMNQYGFFKHWFLTFCIWILEIWFPPLKRPPSGSLKGTVQKWKLCHHLFTFMLFQTEMIYFLPWNTITMSGQKKLKLNPYDLCTVFQVFWSHALKSVFSEWIMFSCCDWIIESDWLKITFIQLSVFL